MENQNSGVTKLFYIGIALTIISYCFMLSPAESRSRDILSGGGAFLINYGIAITYLVVILIYNVSANGWRVHKLDFRLFAIWLMLFTVSGFSLNSDMSMFAEFVTWLKWYVVIMHVTLLGLCFIDKRPAVVKTPLFFMTGASLVIALYFTLYMFPVLPFAVVFCFYFGLTLHALIPLLWTITLLVQFFKKKNSSRHSIAFFAGFMLPVIIACFQLYKWTRVDRLIHEVNATVITRPDNELPKWVLLSQILPDDPFTTKILKGRLGFDRWDTDFRGGRGGRGFWDEQRKHDPIASIALAGRQELDLTQEERIKILQSMYDARHATQRKLWSDRHLATSEVLTNIQVFPDYRLAYIEKIISIEHKGEITWQSTEEAAYTFHLPEGSVATSLSLWVNGVEEKSRLTTKAKADSAYVEIVGVQRRDPALLHWQEGNTITVTVFPCTPQEQRKFRIGITIPLEKRKDKLVLKNVYFEGPEISDAMETTVIEFVTSGSFTPPKFPAAYDGVGDKRYQYTGKYKPYWEIEMNETPLSGNAFVFNNKSFRAAPLSTETENFDPSIIYLDINKSWSKDEFNEVWNMIKEKEVFVFHDGLVKLTHDNKDSMLRTLRKNNFSLFPFHKLLYPEKTLVISKSTMLSPNLAELKGSSFFQDMKNVLTGANPPRLFSLTKELSPYLKTLKEYRVFNADFGDIEKLHAYLSQKQFPRHEPNDNAIELDMAEIQIVSDSTASTAASAAPDHLMRLFAYNQVLKKIGKNFFCGDEYISDDLISIANEAYVVTPVSSLVVLETLNDYERFGIEENQNSLQNASTHSSGAVPEPHEWALIILTAIMLLWMYFRTRVRVAV